MYISALFALVGLLLYLFVKDPEKGNIKEVGRIMFWTGLLAWLFSPGPAHMAQALRF